MNREEDPKLWDLLGRAQKVEPSPFFARNVVRAVRRRRSRRPQEWSSRPASSAGEAPVDWVAESAKNCSNIIGDRCGTVNDYGGGDFPPAFGADWARAYSAG